MSSSAIPAPWQERFSKSQNRVYYENPETGKKAWSLAEIQPFTGSHLASAHPSDAPSNKYRQGLGFGGHDTPAPADIESKWQRPQSGHAPAGPTYNAVAPPSGGRSGPSGYSNQRGNSNSYSSSQSQHHHSGPRSLLTDAERQVFKDLGLRTGKYIEKEFVLSDSCLPLPPIESIFRDPEFCDEQMMQWKDELNAAKGSLDGVDLKLWDSHTKFTNLLGDVPFRARREIDTEMCTIAWLKMYEMLDAYRLAPSKDTEDTEPNFKSVHVCEAPGAFICATNHYLRTRGSPAQYEAEFKWRAVSLNPFYEGNDLGAMIDDDRLIIETRPHWMFGIDNSGDIRQGDNIRSFWQRAREDGCAPCALVTGDGSIDCNDNPAEQEAVTAQLHYCELVAALGLLKPGGNLVLKAFTLYEHSSICMLRLMASCFDRLLVVKPATSKSGNSETYWVGMGYRPMPLAYLERLLEFTGDNWHTPLSLFGVDVIEPDFMNQCRRAAHLFGRLSECVIRRNAGLFQNMSPAVRASIQNDKKAAGNEWFDRFAVKPLKPNFRLAPGTNLSGAHQSIGRAQWQGREEKTSSFADRMQSKAASLESEREQLRSMTQGQFFTGRSIKHEEQLRLAGPAVGSTRVRSEVGDVMEEPRPTTRRYGGQALATADDDDQSTCFHAIPLSLQKSEQSSANSNDDWRANGIVVSSVATKLMQSMGLKAGQGLGRHSQGIATVIENRGQFDTMGLGAMSAPTIASTQPAKRKASTSRDFSDSEAEDESGDSEDEIDLSNVPRETLLAPLWPMLVITDDPTQAQVHATAATSRRNQFTSNNTTAVTSAIAAMRGLGQSFKPIPAHAVPSWWHSRRVTLEITKSTGFDSSTVEEMDYDAQPQSATAAPGVREPVWIIEVARPVAMVNLSRFMDDVLLKKLNKSRIWLQHTFAADALELQRRGTVSFVNPTTSRALLAVAAGVGVTFANAAESAMETSDTDMHMMDAVYNVDLSVAPEQLSHSLFEAAARKARFASHHLHRLNVAQIFKLKSPKIESDASNQQRHEILRIFASNAAFAHSGAWEYIELASDGKLLHPFFSSAASQHIAFLDLTEGAASEGCLALSHAALQTAQSLREIQTRSFVVSNCAADRIFASRFSSACGSSDAVKLMPTRDYTLDAFNQVLSDLATETKSGRVQIVFADAFAPSRVMSVVPLMAEDGSKLRDYRHEQHEQLLICASLVAGSPEEIRRRCAVERHLLWSLLLALASLDISPLASTISAANAAPRTSHASTAMEAAFRSSFVKASNSNPTPSSSDATNTDSGSFNNEQPGGTFVCRVPECTTRLNAAVFFILHRLFSRVSFVKPASSCRATNDRFLVAQNFLGASAQLMDYLHETIRQYDMALAAEIPKHSVVEIVPVDFLLLPRVFAYLNDAHAQLGQAELRALDAMLQNESSSRNLEGELEDLKSKCKRCISELAQLTQPPTSTSDDLDSPMMDQGTRVSSEFDLKYQSAASNQFFDSPPTAPFESWILGLSDKVLRQSELDFRKLDTVSASRYSSLMPSHIADVRLTLDKWFRSNPPARIIDATAHIGVDSLNFALHFRKQSPQVHIRSFEPNPETFACLQRNVRAANLSGLISAEQGSCLDLLKVPSAVPAIASAQAALEDKVDMVYIDAPWGGTEYKDSEKMHLYLSDERHGEVDILDLTRYLLSSRQTRTVVLKVPANFCFDEVDRMGLSVMRQDILQPSRRIAFVLLRVE